MFIRDTFHITVSIFLSSKKLFCLVILSHLSRHTSKGADVVLLGGDLNMHPEDIGIRLLRGWTGLQDSFIAAEKIKVSIFACTST